MAPIASEKLRSVTAIPLSISGPTIELPHNAMTIIPNRFCWATLDIPPTSNSQTHYFCVDEVYKYDAFNRDFGPLNLSCVYNYCRLVSQKLSSESVTRRCVVHYSSSISSIRANAAFLVGAFQIIILSKDVSRVCAALENLCPTLIDYRDASSKFPHFYISVCDCLRGLARAIRLNWFDFDTFDVHNYEHYSKVENGDINWIIPDKLAAFSTPVPSRSSKLNGLTPEEYVTIFNRLDVTAVVRINESTSYDRNLFVERGMKHYDLFFPDGTAPSKSIVRKFFKIVDENKKVAVHCYAGLGRTGTLIGCYAIKTYSFPHPEWIGWNRIVRPGSILGCQHYFLKMLQSSIMKHGTSEYEITSEELEELEKEEMEHEIVPGNQEASANFDSQKQGQSLRTKRLLNTARKLQDGSKEKTISWNYGNALLLS